MQLEVMNIGGKRVNGGTLERRRDSDSRSVFGGTMEHRSDSDIKSVLMSQLLS